MKGFTRDGKFHPITTYKSVKKKRSSTVSLGTVIRKQRKHDEPVNFTTAVNRFEKFRDSTDIDGYTFDPTGNIGYDFTDVSQTKKFYDKFIKPKFKGKTLFQIGTTNNVLASVPRDLEAEYSSVRLEKSLPMFGYYRNKFGTEFTDISFAVSGISDRRAVEIARDKKQMDFFKIYPDGTALLEETGITREKAVTNPPL